LSLVLNYARLLDRNSNPRNVLGSDEGFRRSPFTLNAWRRDLRLPFVLLSDFNKDALRTYDSLYDELLGLKGVTGAWRLRHRSRRHDSVELRLSGPERSS
jgi:hypothetical protein